MLGRYRDNPKIMLISGDNFLGDVERKTRQDTSYYFSRYCMTWGWATWSRVWKFYDYNMKNLLTEEAGNKIKKILKTKEEQKYWFDVFKKEYYKKNAWDYQLTYAIWQNDGLCVTPTVNLISNVGFGEGAANTINPNHPAAKLLTENLKFPLVHPTKITVDTKADSYIFRHHFLKKPSFKSRIRNFVRRVFTR